MDMMLPSSLIFLMCCLCTITASGHIDGLLKGDDNSNCKDGLFGNDDSCTSGCKQGYRGPFCTMQCSEHCNAACSQDTGQCLTGCKSNWFTLNCTKPCSGNCEDDSCDIRTGECIHGCKDGFYGQACNMNCSENCLEGRCDRYGGCPCKKGIRDEFCYINCEDCVAEDCIVDAKGQPVCIQGCKAERDGSFCKELAPCAERTDCRSEVVDRKKRDTNHCYEEDDIGRCNCCEEGWRGPMCDIECKACRYSYRNNCSLACLGGYFGNECHLPCPDDCSRATNGRSRCDQDGVCDSGCLQGYYGFICERTCPLTCLARTCFMNNGSCTDGCVPGRWGPKCDYECGHCIDLKCERDGTCTCEDGYYGPRCEAKCSDNCVSANCSITSDGKHVCDGDCQPSFTGEDCLSRCPRHCYNDHCEKATGVCDPENSGSIQDNGPQNMVIIGAVCRGVGGLLLIAIILGVLCFRKMSSNIEATQRDISEMSNQMRSFDVPPAYDYCMKT